MFNKSSPRPVDQSLNSCSDSQISFQENVQTETSLGFLPPDSFVTQAPNSTIAFHCQNKQLCRTILQHFQQETEVFDLKIPIDRIICCLQRQSLQKTVPSILAPLNQKLFQQTKIPVDQELISHHSIIIQSNLNLYEVVVSAVNDLQLQRALLSRQMSYWQGSINLVLQMQEEFGEASLESTCSLDDRYSRAKSPKLEIESGIFCGQKVILVCPNRLIELGQELRCLCGFPIQTSIIPLNYSAKLVSQTAKPAKAVSKISYPLQTEHKDRFMQTNTESGRQVTKTGLIMNHIPCKEISAAKQQPKIQTFQRESFKEFQNLQLAVQQESNFILFDSQQKKFFIYLQKEKEVRELKMDFKLENPIFCCKIRDQFFIFDLQNRKKSQFSNQKEEMTIWSGSLVDGKFVAKPQKVKRQTGKFSCGSFGVFVVEDSGKTFFIQLVEVEEEVRRSKTGLENSILKIEQFDLMIKEEEEERQKELEGSKQVNGLQGIKLEDFEL